MIHFQLILQGKILSESDINVLGHPERPQTLTH